MCFFSLFVAILIALNCFLKGYFIFYQWFCLYAFYIVSATISLSSSKVSSWQLIHHCNEPCWRQKSNKSGTWHVWPQTAPHVHVFLYQELPFNYQRYTLCNLFCIFCTSFRSVIHLISFEFTFVKIDYYLRKFSTRENSLFLLAFVYLRPIPSVQPVAWLPNPTSSRPFWRHYVSIKWSGQSHAPYAATFRQIQH
jgi:hypothetical protein